jgi:hypothetical protein
VSPSETLILGMGYERAQGLDAEVLGVSKNRSFVQPGKSVGCWTYGQAFQ